MIIGLTGNIASGKSTVSEMCQKWHIPVIDADKIAHQIVEPQELAYQPIIDAFGEDIVKQDGWIDRKKLGRIVFGNDQARQTLNQITHPAIRKKMQEQKQQLLDQGHRAIVLDIPLLFENQLTYMVDRTLVVYTERSIQLQRLMARNQFTKEEAEKRMNAQMDQEKKKERADAVVDNSGTIGETEKQLVEILRQWGVTI
ncbi:dephospho-CoA kinase [Gracilibacillus halophilus YIM-C55.5]|uniref:Dephospho-CoA kinase n=1 Tax=Gracilibacillus halophilus YIM-C55.5 TaxID=1308866 RepID=N4W9X6_9BACI|nr:dephospho-CoA kinase [Gracilibacillus halophilus]ENH97063.1 dephospho-CoA kinase [Gracilibacillus halophilus YIM-C55.5]